MKKIILLLTFVAITTFSYAQQDTTNYVTESNVEKLVDKYSIKIESAFVALSQKLEQPVSYVWDAFVKVNFAKGLVRLVYPISLIICLLLFIKYLRMSSWKDKNEEFPQEILTVIFAVLGVCMLLGTLFTLTGTVTRLMSPEYHALKEVFELFKGV